MFIHWSLRIVSANFHYMYTVEKAKYIELMYS